MKKIELERALVDTEGLKKLSERATAIKGKHGEGRNQPAAKIQPVQPQPHLVRPTTAEAMANDRDHMEQPQLLANISRLYPQLAKENRGEEPSTERAKIQEAKARE